MSHQKVKGVKLAFVYKDCRKFKFLPLMVEFFTQFDCMGFILHAIGLCLTSRGKTVIYFIVL